MQDFIKIGRHKNKLHSLVNDVIQFGQVVETLFSFFPASKIDLSKLAR